VPSVTFRLIKSARGEYPAEPVFEHVNQAIGRLLPGGVDHLNGRVDSSVLFLQLGLFRRHG